jgi:kynurenine formamidase
LLLLAAISKALNGKTRSNCHQDLPNDADKVSRKTFHTNPPYLAQEAALFLHESGIQHLLIDLPSVDKEKRMKGNYWRTKPFGMLLM